MDASNHFTVIILILGSRYFTLFSCPISSGKSTILHAISGKVKEDKKISLYGKRYINNVPLTGDSKIPSAFIEQEVSFFPHMTVKESEFCCGCSVAVYAIHILCISHIIDSSFCISIKSSTTYTISS